MKKFLSLVIALVMAFSIAAPALAANRPVWVDPDAEVLQYVESAEAVSIVKYLSEEIGVRTALSDEEMEAAEYILSKFNEYGYGDKADDPNNFAEIQMFNYNANGTATTRHLGYLAIHDADKYMDNPAVTFAGTSTLYGRPLPYNILYQEHHGKVWNVGSGANSVLTGKDGKVTGQVVFCGNGGTDADFANAAGKIALVNVNTSAAIATRAQNAGAIGLIGYSTALGGRGNWSQVGNNDTAMNAGSTLVGVAVANIHGEWLRTMSLSDTPLVVDISTYPITQTQSPNVIGVKKAKNNPDTAPIIFITSHLDSVKSSPGGNDNATGVAYVLAAAKAMANVNTDDVEIRFCSFGSEEVGLIGSNRYVAALSAEEKARGIACFNADMMSPKEYSHTKFLHVATADGRPNAASDAMMAAANRLGVIYEVVQGMFPSSDHVPFHNAGIPAMMAIRHGPGVEGTRIITNSSYTVERGYHTPYDNFSDNVDAERMDLGCRLVTAAVYSMAVPREFELTTKANLVQSGDKFTVEGKFTKTPNSNVAMIYYNYDPDKFEYASFTPVNGVDVVNTVINEEDGEVQITLMRRDYKFEDVGSIELLAKGEFENGYENVTATVRYVVDVDGAKVEKLTGGKASFTTYKIPDEFTLIDLSNLIDIYGKTLFDEGWYSTYAFWDFNSNGEIDINDVVFVAQKIK